MPRFPLLVLLLMIVGPIAAPAAAQATTPVPRIAFRQFTLPNGMQVVLSEDHTVPIVTECMIFDVGARDEHNGRSGFAHLFEHLMFEGSKDAPKGVFDKVVEGYGGSDNANTHEDYTFYYETVPSNVLPAVIWLDADRIASLNVTAENMKNQVSVVEEEKRMRVDNAPYGKLMYEDMGNAAFTNWQDAHSVIGSNTDLDAASLADVKAFFDAYYAPRNGILVLVGDFDGARTEALVRQYFGVIANRGTIVPVDTAEPPQTAPKEVTVNDPEAKLPAVAFAWHGPARDTTDFYALTMLGQYFFDGESGRMYQALVKESQLALQLEGGLGFPSADFTDYRAPGLFAGVAIYKTGVTPAQVRDVIAAEVEKVADSGIPATDLERIKTKFAAEWISNEQATLDRGQLLALAALFEKNPDAANTELPHFLAVSNADLRHAAQQYLGASQITTVVDVPGGAPPAGTAGIHGGGQ